MTEFDLFAEYLPEGVRTTLDEIFFSHQLDWIKERLIGKEKLEKLKSEFDEALKTNDDVVERVTKNQELKEKSLDVYNKVSDMLEKELFSTPKGKELFAKLVEAARYADVCVFVDRLFASHTLRADCSCVFPQRRPYSRRSRLAPNERTRPDSSTTS